MRNEFYEDLKLVAFAIGAGAYLLASAFHRRKKTRALQDLARSKISAAAQGLVEIEGWAFHYDSHPPVLSLDGKKCVFYHLQIQLRTGKDSYETIAEHLPKNPILICDLSGAATVDPSEIEIDVEPRISDWRKLSPEARASALNLINIGHNHPNLPSVTPGFISNSYRVIEKKIMLASPILVHAEFYTRAQENISISQPWLLTFHKRLSSIVKNPLRYKSMFDRNSNGTISDEEARDGYYMAAITTKVLDERNKDSSHFAGANPKNSALNPLKHYGYLRKHPVYPSFITDCHEVHAIARMGFGVYFAIFLGMALVICAIGYALQFFSLS